VDGERAAVQGDGAWARFRRDTATSAGVWARHPGLPLLTLLVWLPISIPGAWRSYIMLPFFFFFFALGFCGMQREWYATAFAGDRPTGRRIWRGTWRYVPRLLPIGIVVVLIPCLLMVVLLPLFGVLNQSMDADSFFLRIRIAFVVQAFLVDFLLTFVMPALVFTTANPVRAVRIGLRYLRRVWPTVKWHVLAPPTAILAIGQVASGSNGGMVRGALISLSGVMLGLLFKGAQLRAYFEHADELGVPIGGPQLPDTGGHSESVLEYRRRRSDAP
jgi:hypothetical protein